MKTLAGLNKNFGSRGLVARELMVHQLRPEFDAVPNKRYRSCRLIAPRSRATTALRQTDYRWQTRRRQFTRRGGTPAQVIQQSRSNGNEPVSKCRRHGAWSLYCSCTPPSSCTVGIGRNAAPTISFNNLASYIEWMTARLLNEI